MKADSTNRLIEALKKRAKEQEAVLKELESLRVENARLKMEVEFQYAEIKKLREILEAIKYGDSK